MYFKGKRTHLIQTLSPVKRTLEIYIQEEFLFVCFPALIPERILYFKARFSLPRVPLTFRKFLGNIGQKFVHVFRKNIANIYILYFTYIQLRYSTNLYLILIIIAVPLGEI